MPTATQLGMHGLYFEVTGQYLGTVGTLAWTEEEGFDKPWCEALINDGETVARTPTGPFYLAADRPATVALLTAMAVFDSWLDRGKRALTISGDYEEILALDPVPAIAPGDAA